MKKGGTGLHKTIREIFSKWRQNSLPQLIPSPLTGALNIHAGQSTKLSNKMVLKDINNQITILDVCLSTCDIYFTYNLA